VEPWDFPEKFDQLWNELSDERKGQIIHGCASEIKKGTCQQLIDLIAERLHTSVQTIQKWPLDKFKSHLEKYRVADNLTDRIVYAYVKSLDPFRFDANDNFGEDDLDEDDCYLPSSIEEAVVNLLGHYDYEDVKLLMQFAAITKIGHWSRVSEIDFDRIELLIEEGESLGVCRG